MLVGHGLGEMICRLLSPIPETKSGAISFGTPPAKAPLTSGTRQLLEKAFVFNHRLEVKRVIFISTPHRGSKLASGLIGRIGASQVKTPQGFTWIYRAAKPILIADPIPNSSDGVVPYWSSHLDGTQSHLIVHSDHQAKEFGGD